MHFLLRFQTFKFLDTDHQINWNGAKYTGAEKSLTFEVNADLKILLIEIDLVRMCKHYVHWDFDCLFRLLCTAWNSRWIKVLETLQDRSNINWVRSPHLLLLLMQRGLNKIHSQFSGEISHSRPLQLATWSSKRNNRDGPRVELYILLL